MAQPGLLRVGLIGANIQRSRTPALHMEEARAHGLNLQYDLIDLDQRGRGPAALPRLLAEAEAAGFVGLNITHPCKQQVIALLDTLSDDARQLGAVNTVVFRDGRRTGHNTDWSGFLEGFRRGLPGAPLRTVVQIGAGGAGVAVAHACLKMAVDRLYLHDAVPGRAEGLAKDLNHRAGRDFARAATDVVGVMATADGLINATPVGMDLHPGLPLDARLLKPDHWVAEIVYFPLETALLTTARQKGCRVVNGGGMAVFQAAAAFRLFTGRDPDPDRMLAHFARMARDAG
ncbi:MAG: shikimate dehydrogenase [bacterium]